MRSCARARNLQKILLKYIAKKDIHRQNISSIAICPPHLAYPPSPSLGYSMCDIDGNGQL